MNDTQAPTVKIPADVLHNSPHTVRIVSNGTRALFGDELNNTRQNTQLFGYTMYEWDETSKDGDRITLTWFADSAGRAVWLYETTYYTRVKCEQCEYHWASVYQMITTTSDIVTVPVARCDEDAREFRRSMGHEPHATLHESERLNPGRH